MKKKMEIRGMACGNCAAHVKEALESVPGVTAAEVSLGKNEAVVDGASLDEAALKAAVEDAGYEVAGIA
jgi:copper chaperone CopZ